MTTPPEFRLRPIVDGDAEVLFLIYASTRAEELAVVDWDDATKAGFLRQQFQLQHQYYHREYPDAAFLLVLVAEVPAGRWYVHWGTKEIRIIDLALLPEFRRQGMGSALLQGLIGEAQRAALRVTLHVETSNPARRLYERLGFVAVAGNGVHDLMEWRLDAEVPLKLGSAPATVASPPDNHPGK